MAALTRSASLTDLSEKEERKRSSNDGTTGEESRAIYGSPQKHSRRMISHRTSTGGSSGTPLHSWKWLSKSRSLHQKSEEKPTSTFSSLNQVKTQRSFGRNAKLDVLRPRFVEHLDSLLPQYCHHLSHPTYQEAAKAMTLLLNNPPAVPVVDTVVAPNAFVPGSPDKKSQQGDRHNARGEKQAKTSVTSEMNRILSSPFRSRRPRRDKWQEDASPRQWTRLSSLGTQSSTSSANSLHNLGKAKTNASSFTDSLDAATWQSFVAPLVLLAGAEAIYADLEHVHPTPTIIQWPGLYQRISSELTAMMPPSLERKLLHPPPMLEAEPILTPGAEPTLQSPPGSPQSPSEVDSKFNQHFFPNEHFTPASGGHTLSTPRKTNISTTPTKEEPGERGQLRSLLAWLDVKCRWLPFHESLFLTWNSDNLSYLRGFAASLPPLPLPKESQYGHGCGRPMMEALRQEIQATLSLMEMAFWLERGRFLETIVSARKVKLHLVAVGHKETALILWMKTTFQDYLSVMPLVFDKIHAFATPLYGFDQQILLEATHSERLFLDDRKGVIDLDTLVVDFLRRQERAGGAAMAVAVVLDTDGLEDSEEENHAPNPRPAQPGSRTPNRVAQHGYHHRIELGYAIRGNHTQNLAGGLAQSSRHSLEMQQDLKTSSKSQTDKEQKATNVAERRLWPATYLRSTMRLGTPARGTASGTAGGGMGLISGMRRNAGAARGSGSALDGTSSVQHGSGMHLSQSRSSVDGSPRSKYRKSTSNRRCSLLSHGNVFEYETEPSTRPSWPHSEWDQLRTILETLENGTWPENIVTDHSSCSPPSTPTRGGDTKTKAGLYDQPMAITFHPDGAEPEGQAAAGSSAALDSRGSIFSSDLGKQLWDPLPTVSLPQGGSTSSNNAASSTAPTTFHAVQLNNFMWMIVMVKGEEESRWHRRKSRGLADTEIRAFLNDMAAKLSISNRFLGLKTCQTARVKVKDRLAPRVRGRDLGLRDAQWQSSNPDDDDQVQEDVLQLMKEAFSVSGTSPSLNRAESILTTMSGGFRPTGATSRSPRARDRRRVLALQKQSGPFASNSDYREGAAMLFLGPELFRQFLESTSE